MNIEEEHPAQSHEEALGGMRILWGTDCSTINAPGFKISR